ncbi:MAG: Flagellar hook-length control protein FliK [Thermodesulfobacterium sp.]|uniref:Flagellar hook-length control protein FliK n=1 Tax=Candidatus Thermodesulfobacterium syntrophicum TaxID=3060442 RepID=A0AAE3P1X7_9BACT|nr:Flagellar hook-length control protein FliK [Candidatus Thermodesulfobacterium syntrophicum]
MIKLVNCSPNSCISGSDKTFSNKFDGKISDWFQLILLSLIDKTILSGENDSEDNLFSEELADVLNDNKNLSKELSGNKGLEELNLSLGYILRSNIFQQNNFSATLNEDGLTRSQKISLWNNFITQLLNIDNTNNFKTEEEKLSFIEEIISFLSQQEGLESKNISNSRINQVLAKILSEFNENELLELQNEIVGRTDLLKLQENKKVLNNDVVPSFEDRAKWLEILRLLKELQSLTKMQNSDVLNSQAQVNNLNKDNFQGLVNNFQINTAGKLISENKNLEEILKSQLDKVERKSFVTDNVKFLNSSKNYSNLDGQKDGPKEFFNFDDIVRIVVSENDNSTSKKVGLLKKNLSFYDILNKRSETQINPFQKIVNNELVKSVFDVENVNKTEDIKNANFYRLPDTFMEIVKDMVLEIQPEGEKKALIKLEPPEMGSLDLEIKVKNKDIEIVARIEKQEVLQEIKQNLHHIKASLEESGFNLRNFQLLLGSGFDGGSFVKNFQREGEKYFYGEKSEKLEEVNEDTIKNEDLVKFYNKKGNYYYIV